MNKEEQAKEQSQKEAFLRQICDKQTNDALNILKSINVKRYELAEKEVVGFFKKYNSLVTFEAYSEIVKKIDQEVKIYYKRRNDTYDLEDVSDF